MQVRRSTETEITHRRRSELVTGGDWFGAQRTTCAELIVAPICSALPIGALCVAERVPPEVIAFGRRAQQELVRQAAARELARMCGLQLEGFGGTQDGVIGALAGVGLLASGDDGRVVHRMGWGWPDAFTGLQPVAAVRERGVDDVCDAASGSPVDAGLVDVGKHLRPSYRGGRVVLYVEASETERPRYWRALKLP